MTLTLPQSLVAGTPQDVNDLNDNLNAIVTYANAQTPTYVTSLPGSPADGQEVYYGADPTNGVIWHLRYRTAATGSYKWEYVGGPPMSAEVVAAESTASATFTNLTTVGPSLTAPLAGDFDFHFGATSYKTGAGPAYHTMGLSFAGAAPALQCNWTDTLGGYTLPHSVTARTVSVSVSTSIVAKYVCGGGFTATFGSRFIRMTPVRVG